MAESSPLNLPDAAATARLGAALAAAISQVRPAGLVIYLEGPLGAGKTELCRGLLHGLGHPGRVPSPTYTLIEPYTVGDYRVLHADLYRLKDPAELEFLGLRDEIGAGAILLVEWPAQGGDLLPLPDLQVTLGHPPPPGPPAGAGRLAGVQAFTAAGQSVLSRWREAAPPS
jgi:tRNA threonylcarbamoyladenosine biosynthesis protein TsaE